MSDHPLKILIVGGGSAGRRHFRYLHEHGEQCTVCDPSDTCRVLQEFPNADRVTDFDTTNLSAFDAVVICTPPFLHVPQMIRAIRAGCHVLAEKPITVLNHDGLDELLTLASEDKVIACVSFPYANMKAMDRVIELVNTDRIGTVRTVHVRHGQNILAARPDFYDTYYASDEMGGGALQDDANHILTGLELLFGTEEEITCQRHNIGTGRGNMTVDDTAFMWIRYPGDVIVNIDFTMQCHFNHYDWIINGKTGAIRMFIIEPRLEILDATTGETSVETFDDSWDETFRANDHNFVAAIRGKESVRCTLDMAIANHVAVLAGRESAATGKAVRIRPFGT